MALKHLLWLLLLFGETPGLYGQSPASSTSGIEPNVIRWGTASEHDNFGYDVYRGLSEDGPFEVINADPIAGAGTTDLPQRYEFHDRSILPDTAYWYYIESISLNGDRRRISPIYQSKPKPAIDQDG